MRAEYLYVHVPFCARRCSYCDFSIAVRREVPVDDFLRGLAGELDARLDRSSHLRTVYFGGGTPSRLGGAGLAAAVELVRTRATVSADAEITIEVNPEDVTQDAVSAWRNAGINRASLGIQSFHDDVLRWMHRVHDADAAREALHTIRRGGIENVSLDLIFAVPRDLHRDWRRDLRDAIVLEPSHVSLYGLTVEPHTPLGRWRERGTVTESPEEHYADEYLLAHEQLAAAGFEHYEVSNFGRPGLHAIHNAAYWRRVPYYGFGPSAHEFDGAHRRWNVGPYVRWLQLVDSGNDPLEGSEAVEGESEIAETVYLGLRTSDGLLLNRDELSHVQPWVAAGWGVVSSDVLRLTAQGWLRLDALAADLTALRSR